MYSSRNILIRFFTLFHCFIWLMSVHCRINAFESCEGNPPTTNGLPSQWASVAGFDVFFDVNPNKRVNKQPRSRCFKTPCHSLWRHCNVKQTKTNIQLFVHFCFQSEGARITPAFVLWRFGTRSVCAQKLGLSTRCTDLWRLPLRGMGRGPVLHPLPP